jgi:hypothetical protein
MSQEDSVAPLSAPAATSEISQKAEPREFGGWLILVGLGIVLAIVFAITRYFAAGFAPHAIFEWILVGKTMTSPEPYPNEKFWNVVVAGETAVNIGAVIAWIYLAFLFYRKRKNFPVLYACALAINVGMQIFNANLLGAGVPGGDPPDATITTVGGSVITAAIWIPYILISKRVKATFIT